MPAMPHQRIFNRNADCVEQHLFLMRSRQKCVALNQQLFFPFLNVAATDLQTT
jgi:hypothetical protein